MESSFLKEIEKEAIQLSLQRNQGKKAATAGFPAEEQGPKSRSEVRKTEHFPEQKLAEGKRTGEKGELLPLIQFE